MPANGMKPTTPDSRAAVLVSILLVAVTAGVFWNLGSSDFINYDDLAYVVDNAQVQAGLTWRGVAWAFTTTHAANWHPLTWISHMLDVALWGKNAGGHHLTSVALHAANSVLLFWLLRKITRELWPSAFVAALFAWHPMHVESVAWVSERKDVLSTFFGLISLMFYAHRAERFGVQSPESRVQSPKPPRHLPSSIFYLLSLLCFALSLLSKPMWVTMPFVMLLLDYWPLDRFARGAVKRLILEKWSFFALSAAACVVTFWAQHTGGAVRSLESIPVTARLCNGIVAYMLYSWKMIWPANLAVFYPHPVSQPDWKIGIGVAMLAAAATSAILSFRKRPYVAVGFLFFLGMLVPVIGLVQVGDQAMADRYSYVPLIGLFIAIVWHIAKWIRGSAVKTTVSVASGCAALSLLLVLTHKQTLLWETSERLFRHSIAITGHNASASYSLACALKDAGKLDEAVLNVTQALKDDPGFADAYCTLAQIHELQGDISGTIENYNRALVIKPDLAGAHNNLAWLLATCDNPAFRNGAEAVMHGERACELADFKCTLFIGTLAAAYAEAGRFQDAASTAERAIAFARQWNEQKLASKNMELLELYRAEKPFRETGQSKP